MFNPSLAADSPESVGKQGHKMRKVLVNDERLSKMTTRKWLNAADLGVENNRELDRYPKSDDGMRRTSLSDAVLCNLGLQKGKQSPLLGYLDPEFCFQTYTQIQNI